MTSSERTLGEILADVLAGKPDHEADLDTLSDFFFDAQADDRTIGIIGASYCERDITEVLAARLPGLNGTLRKRLFGGPLARGRVQFDLAQALGVIDGAMNSRLRTLFEIRNAFAHNLNVSTVEHPEVAELIDKLTMPKGYSDTYLTVINRLGRRERLKAIAFMQCVVLAELCGSQPHAALLSLSQTATRGSEP